MAAFSDALKQSFLLGFLSRLSPVAFLGSLLHQRGDGERRAGSFVEGSRGEAEVGQLQGVQGGRVGGRGGAARSPEGGGCHGHEKKRVRAGSSFLGRLHDWKQKQRVKVMLYSSQLGCFKLVYQEERRLYGLPMWRRS